MGSFNINSIKDSIRKTVGGNRSTLKDYEVWQKSSLVCSHLLLLDIFKLSKKIGLYFPIQNEVNTQSIFSHAIESEKEVYFPRVNGSSLDFHKVDDLTQLELGQFNVPEPKDSLTKSKIENIDLFIIPALAFDKSGNRLGFGKGYYDRALRDVPQNKKVGLAYNFQILDSVPTNDNDRAVGSVISEQGIVFSRRNLGGK